MNDTACDNIVTNLCGSVGIAESSCNSNTSSKITSSVSTSDCVISRVCDCPHEKPPKFIPPPNLQHELNIAKSILLESSSVTGDNLFDHLAELIKKITDQRPPNVVDYFEEFSRNVREQKFHNPDNYLEDANDEPRTLREAETIISALKLNVCDKPEDEEYNNNKNNDDDDDMNINCNIEELYQLHRPVQFSENILQIKLFWSICGFSMKFDEVYQLSFAMMKLIQCPIIELCRFWGKMYGLNNTYYIVEVDFIKSEKERRYEQMQIEMAEKILNYQNDLMTTRYMSINGISGEELIPGLKWIEKNYEGVELMLPDAAPIPQPIIDEQFDIPPEPVGSGLNRCAYFVIKCLTDEWIELPIVTPKQIIVSRQIKKYLTGDLEANINSYPIFPGKEKHYLRAMIARITASTYIAPIGYYRKRTKKDDRMPGDEEEDEEEEGEEEEEEDEEDGMLSNKQILKLLKERDSLIIPNKKYKILPIEDMASSSQWVHIRPSILDQGRVMYFDAEKTLKKENGEEEEEENDGEEEDDEEGGKNKGVPDEAIGPALFSACEDDTTSNVFAVWSSRLTSKFNKMNRIAILRSNIWPGSYSFTYEKFCDTIYIGWGDKYVPRNIEIPHIIEIEEEYEIGPDMKETIDPTPQMEEEWRLAHLIPEPGDQNEDCYEPEDDPEEDKDY